MGERIAGKQDGPGPIIYGAPRAPRIAKNVHFCILWPIYGSYFCPLLYICLLCDEVLLPWNFRSPGFDIRAPQNPQIWKKIYICFHILGLTLTNSYLIVSLFDMYMDMGERIAGKQDRPSAITEDPLKKTDFQIDSPCSLLYICLHCDEGCIWWHFGDPGTPGFYVRAQHNPGKKNCIL